MVALAMFQVPYNRKYPDASVWLNNQPNVATWDYAQAKEAPGYEVWMKRYRSLKPGVDSLYQFLDGIRHCIEMQKNRKERKASREMAKEISSLAEMRALDLNCRNDSFKRCDMNKDLSDPPFFFMSLSSGISYYLQHNHF
jgi:hypothetical protein